MSKEIRESKNKRRQGSKPGLQKPIKEDEELQ
jgi:hypothetical protein